MRQMPLIIVESNHNKQNYGNFEKKNDLLAKKQKGK